MQAHFVRAGLLASYVAPLGLLACMVAADAFLLDVFVATHLGSLQSTIQAGVVMVAS